MVNRSANRLVLHQERCDRCKRCVAACPENAIKVTLQYLYVDWRKCDGCIECVDVCRPRAIEAVPALQAIAGGQAAAAVVGSRAEVKALKKRAEADAQARKKAATKAQRAEVRADKTAIRDTQLSVDGTARWTLVDAAIVAVVLLGLLYLKDVVLGTKWVHLMPLQGAVWARAGVLAIFYLVQIGVLAWRADRHGMGLVRAFGLGRMRRGWLWHLVSVGLTVAMLIATRLFTTAYAEVAKLGGWTLPDRVTGDLPELFGPGWVGVGLAVALVVLAAPLIEELVFRGVVQTALERWGPWAAIVGSSALFAAYHMTLFWLVPYFVLGLALGWLAWYRRGLWPSIVMHAAYNAIAVAAAYWIVMAR